MTSTRKFYIVDLIRRRKEFANLDIPPIRVNIVIEIEGKAEVPKTKMDRLEKVGRDKLDEYEKIITVECDRLNKKIEKYKMAGDTEEAEKVAKEATLAIQGALHNAETAAVQAIAEAKKKEAQGDKLLTEAHVKTVVTFVFSGVKVATSVVRIGASHGADVHAWYSLTKELIKIGLEIKQQLKGEEKLRQDVIDGINAYIALRETVIMQAAKRQGLDSPGDLKWPGAITTLAGKIATAGQEISKGRSAQTIAASISDFVVKGITAKVNDAGKAREAYRNHTVKMRQSVDKVGSQGDKLFQAMKKATTLKDGVKIGAQCMQVRAKSTRMAQALEDAQKFLNESQATMEGLGLKFDDQTILQKLAGLKLGTIASEGMSLGENISAIKDLVDAVASAVG